MPVVMGRKTFQSIGNKPLAGRKNIVITRQPGWTAGGVSVVDSVDAAAALAEELNYKEIFIIGGGQIYMIAYEKANKIYMTRVHTEVEGDTYFPVIEKNDWKLISNTDNVADEKHAYSYSFQLWERK